MAKSDLVYTPSHVANFFLETAHKERKPLKMLKLQKLVYFGYGWFLALTGRELFDTKKHPIRRYRYGPVIESLYQEFKFLGNQPIHFYSSGLDEETEVFDFVHIPLYDIKTREILKKVWCIYQRFSGQDLSVLTHHDDSPWDKADQNGAFALDKKDIKSYFASRIENYKMDRYRA